MNKSLATAWVKALRSGKFKQGEGALLNRIIDDNDNVVSQEHCCLGVLATVCRTRKQFDQYDLSDDSIEGSGNLEDIGIYEEVGLSSEDTSFLINHNDGRNRDELIIPKWSFKKIATWIEKKFITNTDKKTK